MRNTKRQEIYNKALKRVHERVEEYPGTSSKHYRSCDLAHLVQQRENIAKAVCHMHYLSARYDLAIKFLEVSAEDNAICKKYGLTPHSQKDLAQAKSILRNVVKRALTYTRKHSFRLYVSYDPADPFFRLDIGGFNPLNDFRDTDLLR